MYDSQALDVAKKIKEAREAAGLSWDDIPVLMPYLNKCWYLDVEHYPDEFASTLDLSWAFILLDHLKTTPENVLADYDMDSELFGSPDEFVQAIQGKISDDEVSLDYVEDQIGWYIEKLLKWPQYVFAYNLEFLIDACKYIRWNWKKCYCLWFVQWNGENGGIEMYNGACKLKFYHLPEETPEAFMGILDRNCPEYKDFMPEHIHIVCLDENQHYQICHAISKEMAVAGIDAEKIRTMKKLLEALRV